MNTLQRICVVAAIALTGLVSTAGAQDFDLSWHTIDGGGGMFSTGGAFELSGTIGQPDAGPGATGMSGGTFELVGGFWNPIIAIPCPGDLNGDRIVDIEDLAFVLSNFGIPGASYSDGDFDRDGIVDIEDVAFIISVYADVCPA